MAFDRLSGTCRILNGNSVSRISNVYLTPILWLPGNFTSMRWEAAVTFITSLRPRYSLSNRPAALHDARQPRRLVFLITVDLLYPVVGLRLYLYSFLDYFFVFIHFVPIFVLLFFILTRIFRLNLFKTDLYIVCRKWDNITVYRRISYSILYAREGWSS